MMQARWQHLQEVIAMRSKPLTALLFRAARSRKLHAGRMWLCQLALEGVASAGIVGAFVAVRRSPPII